METAKVDIRKLQLLNDRINQCIDALAQVRLSVHGLTHSNPQMQGIQGLTGGVGNYGQGSFGTQGFGQNIGQGLGFGQGFGQGQGIFGQQQQNPFWSQQQGVTGGLSHSTPDVLEYSRPTWADPYLASKIYQTFPYAQLQVPPVVSLY